MQDIVNNKVKFREAWRPFAPSVLEEECGRYFDSDHPSPFMILVYDVKEEWRAKLPAITHVDGTARVQTVTRDANPRFYELLETFGRLTGVPVLLNTSFNVQEPIVCTPGEAVRCFQRTQVEWLVLGNLLVGRPGQTSQQHHEC
jgi:carbamoyltransferase